MREERETAGGTRDSTREWLLQLERRLGEIERELERANRRRRRAAWYLSVMVILYLVSLFYTMTILG